MQWIIYKKTRSYVSGCGYYGPSCQGIGVPRGKIYDSYLEAINDASLLQAYNPVGWDVLEYVPGPNLKDYELIVFESQERDFDFGNVHKICD